MVKTNNDGQTFGSWLLAQQNRIGSVGVLIVAARADRKFPKYGTPQEVRKHLEGMTEEGDLFEAVDEAERNWLAC